MLTLGTGDLVLWLEYAPAPFVYMLISPQKKLRIKLSLIEHVG